MNNLSIEAALLSDSYKYGHWKQYPKGTTNVYSYFESRGGEFDKIVFFGLQYYLKAFLEGPVITKEGIERVGRILDSHTPGTFNHSGFNRLLEKHKGYLPVQIYALPEGSIVNPRTPLMAIENTDPEFPWITNFLETLLVLLWHPVTVASSSHRSRKLLEKYLKETSDLEGFDFDITLNTRLHDFGMRGVSSLETGALGGAAHLLSFLGSDTISANIFLEDYYNAKNPSISIPASEHSTITSWGKEYEVDAFRNMLQQFPEGLVACVSDSFDIVSAIKDKWGRALKEEVLNRDGVLVVRPDSGDPIVTTAYIARELWKAFGGTENSKGFKVLNPKIRIIQGDGIDFAMLGNILENFKKIGFSAENIAFGSGGGLLQKFDRDSAKFAFKCSEVIVNGESRDVRKQPMEFDSEGDYKASGKFSKSGRFPELLPVFKDGKLLRETTFEEIREKVMSN